jgi:type IV secretion system protein TrbL
MRRHQTVSHGVSTAAHAVRTSDHTSGGAAVGLSENER